MAKQTIKINLFDSKSLQSAIKQIQQYRDDLPRKCELLCQRLAESGVQVAKTAIAESPQGKTITLTTDIRPEKAGCKAILMATGNTVTSSDGRSFNLLLAVEFGAGIKYNATANPKASEFGMGVGTFPDQTHAFDPNGWYYLGDDGEWHHSYGVKATMPMYQAGVEIRRQILAVAKEVFG